MAIFQPLAARSPQRPPGPAWRNKVLADSADDPDDADKPDVLGSLVHPVKIALGFLFPGPGSGPKVVNSH